MIHYINIEKKRLVGRNNQPNNIPLAIDFHTLGTIDFAFINDCNQIKPIDESLKFYLAGSKKMNREESKLLFLSKTYTIKDNVITFTVDTYTQPFIEEITKKNTEINVEISAETDNAQQVLLRDTAYANPRVYVPGFTPPPVDPTEYYTKTEVDNLLNDYQPVSGMNLYALKSEIPSGGGTFPSAYVSDIDHCYGSVYTVDNYGIISILVGGNQSQRIIAWDFDNLKNNLSIPEYSYSSNYTVLQSSSTIDYTKTINTFLLGENYELNTVNYASNQIYFNDIKMFKIYNPNGYTFKFGYLDYNSSNNFGEYDDNNQRFEKELISSSDTGVLTFLIYKVRHQTENDVMMLNYNGKEWPLYFA